MSEPLARTVRAADPAPVQTERWQDLFWEHGSHAPAAVDRVQASALQQTDLFGWLVPDPPTSRPAAPVVSPARPAAAPISRSRAARLAKPAPAQAVRKLRMTPVAAGYAERRRTVHREEIARLLEVNAGVNGIKVAPSVELPRHRFAAQVDLWKGRPVGTPFVMGN